MNNNKIKTDNRWMFSTHGIKEILNSNKGSKIASLHISKLLIRQLNNIKTAIGKSKLQKDDLQHIDSELEDIVDNCDFLKSLANNDIKESDWDDYSFDGDWNCMTNGILNTLYDLGNMKPIDTTNTRRKLLWVG